MRQGRSRHLQGTWVEWTEGGHDTIELGQDNYQLADRLRTLREEASLRLRVGDRFSFPTVSVVL
jgi:hypothetical protein